MPKENPVAKRFLVRPWNEKMFCTAHRRAVTIEDYFYDDCAVCDNCIIRYAR